MNVRILKSIAGKVAPDSRILTKTSEEQLTSRRRAVKPDRQALSGLLKFSVSVVTAKQVL
jgi:hypothetical protein